MRENVEISSNNNNSHFLCLTTKQNFKNSYHYNKNTILKLSICFKDNRPKPEKRSQYKMNLLTFLEVKFLTSKKSSYLKGNVEILGIRFILESMKITSIS
jgi:hypothetical protein